MTRALLMFGLAPVLVGCVSARINAYYHPKPPEPCEVALRVDGEWKDCASRERAMEYLKDMTPEAL
jgi:hypothetical protein